MNPSPSYDDITWVIPPTVTEDLLEKYPIEVAVEVESNRGDIRDRGVLLLLVAHKEDGI